MGIPTTPGRNGHSQPSTNPESDSLRRDAFARQLCARLCDDRRTLDELRVIDDVLSGLERGADQYGPLDLTSNERDWDEQAAQEARDLLAYLAMRKVAAQHARRERLECEHADRVAPVELGLIELRDSEPTIPTHERFDVGGEG